MIYANLWQPLHGCTNDEIHLSNANMLYNVRVFSASEKYEFIKSVDLVVQYLRIVSKSQRIVSQCPSHTIRLRCHDLLKNRDEVEPVGNNCFSMTTKVFFFAETKLL